MSIVLMMRGVVGFTVIVICLVLVSLVGSTRSKKALQSASSADDPCATLGQSASIVGGPAAARHGRIVAYAECLNERRNYAGMAAALGRLATDAAMKTEHPMAVLHACNQVAELAVGGHVSWDEADRVFNDLHLDWDGNALSLRSHALICTQRQEMERALQYFEASVRLQPDDYTHSQAVVTCQHLKRYADALRHAQAALKLNALPEYHLDVGSALVKLGTPFTSFTGTKVHVLTQKPHL